MASTTPVFSFLNAFGDIPKYNIKPDKIQHSEKSAFKPIRKSSEAKRKLEDEEIDMAIKILQEMKYS